MVKNWHEIYDIREGKFICDFRLINTESDTLGDTYPDIEKSYVNLAKHTSFCVHSLSKKYQILNKSHYYHFCHILKDKLSRIEFYIKQDLDINLKFKWSKMLCKHILKKMSS